MKLQSHRDLHSEEHIAKYQKAAVFMQSVLPFDVSEDLIIEVLCIIEVNAHGFGWSSQSKVGIFPLSAALVSHSCLPNACHSMIHRRLHLRATEVIKPGEEILISYVDLYQPTSRRQQQLAKSKYFNCCCARCVDPTELGKNVASVVCPFCGSTASLLSPPPFFASETTIQCPHCSHTDEWYNFERYVRDITQWYTRGLMFGDINGYLSIVQNYSAWVSPTHWMLFQTYLQLFNYYWKQKNVEEASKYLQLAKTNAELVLPRYCVEKVAILEGSLEVQKASGGDPSTTTTIITELKALLTTCYGAKHPRTIDTLADL
eukprot:TRINITY_DN1565_c0_g1_i2.p1 TRINITY_DN1565_c0_g1~~TRINITY_DN1565_c0_g1_i2.p1  ORF type:complete len:317 (-),score=49.28 TRINITY_DN1565_c0_g1_i2:58-1008(-)